MFIYVASLSDCLEIIDIIMIRKVILEDTFKYASKKINIKDKYRTYIAEILVNMILVNELNIKDISLCRDSNNILKVKDNEIFLSISHSENLIVACVGNSPLGIDVEIINKKNVKIANRFFHQNEIKYIFSSKLNIVYRFYKIWTKKESYYKYVNDGSQSFLKIITTDELGQDNRKLACDFHFKIINNKYALCLCCKKQVKYKVNNIKFIDTYDIINFIYEKYFSLPL